MNGREMVHIGVDFGSLGLRAACFSGKEVKELIGPAEWHDADRWLACEESRNAYPGVRFTPVKDRLGMEAPSAGAVESTPVMAVREFFEKLRRLVDEQSGRPLGHLAIAVPALYSSARRTALCDCAQTAGFSSVNLVNDGVAAVIAYADDGADAQAVLVFGMGYSGFEASVIQVDNGHCRSQASRGSDSVGGAVFDMLIMRDCVRILDEMGLWKPDLRMDMRQWRALRRIAEECKEKLTAEEEIALDVEVATRVGSRQVPMVMSPVGFRCMAGEVLARGLESLRDLLPEVGLTHSDLDAVLLTGGSTRTRLVRDVVADRFQSVPIPLPGDASERGAALYAANLMSNSFVHRCPPAAVRQRSSSYRAMPGSPRLALRLELPALSPPSANRVAVGGGQQESDRHLRCARRYLEEGELERAVAEAHRAYELDPDSPQVFLEMIETHCKAAMALRTESDYEKSIRLLMCAHSHDSTNSQVHKCIAERHFTHAHQASMRADDEVALRALNECLLYDPDHAEGKALRETLSLTGSSKMEGSDK